MTAVEHLLTWMKHNQYFIGNDLLNAIEQAKEMEYKQNMDAMQKGMELQKKENNRIGFIERNGLPSSQTEISDEEIEKEALKLNINTKMPIIHTKEYSYFIQGAIWYREQLKKKQ